MKKFDRGIKADQVDNTAVGLHDVIKAIVVLLDDKREIKAVEQLTKLLVEQHAEVKQVTVEEF